MKTAIEQLMIDSFGEDFRNTVNDYQLNAFQKALEKEKEQIIEAHWQGLKNFSTQYYNETYQNK